MRKHLKALRSRLAFVESESRQLPWAHEQADGTPWRAAEMIRSERYGGRGGPAKIAVLDLHHLDIDTACSAVDAAGGFLRKAGSGLRTLRIIVGMGHGSEGGGRRLAPAISAHLDGVDVLRVTEHTRGAPDGYLDLFHPDRISADALPDPTPFSARQPTGLARQSPTRRRSPARQRSGPRWISELFGLIGSMLFGPKGRRFGRMIGDLIARNVRR